MAEPFLRTVFLRDQFGVRHLNLPYGHALGITKEPGRDTTLYFFSNALMWEKFRKDQKTELEKPSRQLTAGASYKLKSGISVFTSEIFEKPLELLAVEAGKGISAEEQVSLEREEG